MTPATKKEWLASLRQPEAKKQRMTIVPLFVWVILFGFALAAVISKAHAEPLYRAEGDATVVTLFTDPCQFKDKVANLPSKATKEKDGATTEGCAGIKSDQGQVLLFFPDTKTVGSLPVEVFSKVTGI